VLCLLCPVLVAGQEKASWYVPSISSVNELAFRAGDGYDGIQPKTHSDLSATWKTGPVETFVEYDLVNKQFCGGRLTYHATSWLTLYGGILKNPYILELSISPRNLEAIGYSQSASYLGGYGSDLSGISARGRDVGVMADLRLFHREGFDILRLQGGVFNGNGFSFIDNNHFKDISGRIDVHPMKEMTLALGGMTGKYEAAEGIARRSRWSGALWWDDGTYFLRAENTWGKTGELRTNNLAILAGRWFGKHLSPSVRYEWYTRDLDSPSCATHTYLVCLTYKFNTDINIRIQMNRRYFVDGSLSMTWASLGLNLRLAYKP